MVSGLYQIVPELHAALRARGRPRPSRSARVFASEWAVATASSVLRPVGLVAPGPGRGARPVVLVHGYAMARSNFLILARRLRAAGLGPIHAYEYWSMASTSRAAAGLERYLERLCERRGYAEVDLIGHSLGGLVARHAVTIGGAAARVGRVVTLGSPHRGTRTSVLGIGPASREMRPDSPYLRALERAVLPDDIEALSIWSHADSMLDPPDTGSWPAGPSRVYDDLGHMSLLASRRVARDVVHFLTAVGRRASPSSSR